LGVTEPDVARDAPFAPAEVVGGRDVREEVEPLLVAKVRADLDEARGVDDERALAVGLLDPFDTGDLAPGGQKATLRIS
jgi:hypothetical protein